MVWQDLVMPESGGFERALAYITDGILSGEFASGDRLPTERELAETLGIGRSAVREAMKVLQAQGLVTSSVGRGHGTRISSTQGEAFGRMLRLNLALNSTSFSDLTKTRILLEREAIRAAARAPAPERVAELRALIRRQEEATVSEAFNVLDTEFHVAIAAMADNRLLRDLTVAIRWAVANTISQAESALDDWEGVRLSLIADHVGMLEALISGDGDRAAQVTDDHIRRAHAVLLEGGAHGVVEPLE